MGQGAPVDRKERFLLGKSHALRAVAAYAFTVVVCLAFLTRVLRLDEADLAVPFIYGGDGLLNGMWVKSVADNGWYLYNPFLGMPTGLYHQDYPVGETLHFLLFRLFALFSPNFGTTLNLCYLLSYPLTAVLSLYVFRRFGFSYACSIVGSLLFAFLPYHFMRGVGHFFLALYYLVPLAVMVVLWVCAESETLLPRWFARFARGERSAGRIGSRLLAGVAICLLLALAGFYYALFACFLLIIAGSSAALNQRSLSPLAASGFLIGVILLGIIVNAAPNLLYKRTHGKNTAATSRSPIEAEIYGLKISQMVLPITGHRLPFFARVKDAYNKYATLQRNENDFASLGLIGAAGFFLLVGCLLLRNKEILPTGLASLSTLNVFTVLLATTGGFSPIVALILSPQIRAYNRFSVYIAFFSLFAVVCCLDGLHRRYARSRPSRLCFGAFLGVLLVLGLLDQTSPLYRPAHGATAAAFYQDARFVRRIEESVAPRTMIFQLPYEPFPEQHPPTYRMREYQHLRGYLHSKNLRWSYAAMKGREADRWQRAVAAKPLPEMVRALHEAGFRGIYVDRDGYMDGAGKLEKQLARLLCTRPITSEDNRLLFFSMAAYDPKVNQKGAELR